MEEAKSLIAQSKLHLVPCDDLDSAAKTVVTLSKIVDMGKSVDVGVRFEMHI